MPRSKDRALAVASLVQVGDGVDSGRDVEPVVRAPVVLAVEKLFEAASECWQKGRGGRESESKKTES